MERGTEGDFGGEGWEGVDMLVEGWGGIEEFCVKECSEGEGGR